MKFKLFIVLITALILNLLSGCKKTETKINKIKGNSECKEIFKKYNEKFLTEENDSALIYLNQAIKCNPKNNNYKNTKVLFLISINDYDGALKELDELILITNDSTFRLLKAIVLLKINKSNELLKEIYVEYKKLKEPTSISSFYKIALDNYFEGKEYSLIEVKKFKEKYKNKAYETQNIAALEEFIKTQSKEDVLFKIVGIN